MTLEVYQPFWPSVPLGDEVAVGPVLSILSATESLAEPPALCAWQLDVAAAVSLTKFWTPQPESMTTADWASVTLQVTVTFEVYQPFEPGRTAARPW